ncbi:MAG: M20/M25/M40 family metallo-hydrolase [Desulfobacula sp.]|nr:M20/M25/M40 family metallo-hydrolase [Desulfobacula sp.]
MKSIKLIRALSNAPGVSGFEDEVIDVAKAYFNDNAQIEEDRLRNLYIHALCVDNNKPKVMLDAHSDEVGFMIQSINTNGTLKFISLGGWNPQTAGAHAVNIRNTQGEWIRGIVASKPTHFLTPKERKIPASISSMVIDVGATSKKEVMGNFNIQIGAPVVPEVTFSHDKKNDLIIGKAFDDRLGCAALLTVMKDLILKDLDVDVFGVLSTQEELGLRGVKVSVSKTKPDLAIVLEGTPADDTFNSNDFIQAGLKKGPQIRHMDSSVLCNPRFVKFAIDIAKKNKLPFQEAVRSSGGNNAAVITLHDRGIPTIVLGVPVRYIHSHHGIATVSDFENTVKWCKEILKALNRDIIESF